MSSVPTTHKALVTREKKGVVETVPVPSITADEVLVKNISLAINPTDWKHARLGLAPEGSVLGCDFAGTVVAIGPDVKNLKVGDSVYGFIPGGSRFEPENGAFAEYTRQKERFLFKNELKKADTTDLPVGPLTTYEGIVSLIVPILTVGLAVDWAMKIPFWAPADPANKDKIFFIWGGATSLGYLSIQTASRLGFKVVTTASKKHTETLKKLGATEVFDYRDADVIEQIQKYAGDDIVYALDTISENGTTDNVVELVSKTKPAHIVLVLPYTLKNEKPANVTITNVLAYLAVVDKKDFFGIIQSPPGMMDWGAKFITDFSKAVAENPSFILHQPVKVSTGGLADLEPGFETLIQGKNSGFKVVIDL